MTRLYVREYSFDVANQPIVQNEPTVRSTMSGVLEMCVVGIDSEDNIAVYKSTGAGNAYLSAIGSNAIMEADPVAYLNGGHMRVVQRFEDADDNEINRLENELRLQGIYKIEIRSEEFVIVHRGQRTKNIYLNKYGYGPIITTPQGPISLCR